ncbi:hypothetical protein B484DRAFT_85369 [Ochromonadaceae sp. CCMP2298]|nr:hypothetical protein B484DRAFT_85369 [Ochromonadaceae sp. CCMP2298]
MSHIVRCFTRILLVLYWYYTRTVPPVVWGRLMSRCNVQSNRRIKAALLIISISQISACPYAVLWETGSNASPGVSKT